MRGLPRLLFLAVAFGLIVWLLWKLSPDRRTTVQAPTAPAGEAAPPATVAPPWTQEDRALWRETIDRRLGR
jgi:hypothetical protein